MLGESTCADSSDAGTTVETIRVTCAISNASMSVITGKALQELLFHLCTLYSPQKIFRFE